MKGLVETNFTIPWVTRAEPFLTRFSSNVTNGAPLALLLTCRWTSLVYDINPRRTTVHGFSLHFRVSFLKQIFYLFLSMYSVLRIMSAARLITIKKLVFAIHCLNQTFSHIVPFTSSRKFPADRTRVAFFVTACLTHTRCRHISFIRRGPAPVSKTAATVFYIPSRSIKVLTL